MSESSNPTYRTEPRQYHLRWLIAALAMLLGITFFPYLFGGKTFLPADLFDTMTAPNNAHYGPPQAQNHYVFDALAQELPYKIQTKEAFSRGKVAYWNPYILGGYPQYAECLGNNFDPFNILLLWYDPVDVIYWETVIEMFIAGIGMLLLLRFFGISPFVNLIFASGYMLNSMFISSAHYRCPIAAFCWMPFVILMILRYFHYDNWKNILYASVFLALAFLGGNFQTAFFAVFVIAVLVFAFPFGNEKYFFTKRVRIFAGMCILGFALSAIMWLPSLELLFQTIFRGGSLHSTNIYDVYSISQRLLTIPLLIMFFLPEVLGNSQSFNLRKIAGIDIINFNGAIGFLAALFAFWGCVRLWKNRSIRPFIIIGALGIFLPIATPLFSIVYHRFFIVSSLAFCVVGAAAFQSFIDNEKTRLLFSNFFRWTKILFGVITAGLIAAAAYIAINYDALLVTLSSKVAPMIAGSAFGTGNESWMLGRAKKTLDYYSFASPALWIPIACAAITLLSLSFYIKRKIPKKNLLIIIFFTTAIQLFLGARTWFPSIDTVQFPIYPNSAIITALQKQMTVQDGRYTTWRDPSKDPYLLAENAPNVFHIFDMHGYEVCSNRSLSIFCEHNLPFDSLDFRLLGLGNVRYIVLRKLRPNIQYLRPLFSADSMTIYENLLAKPRAYIVYKSNVVESDKAATRELLRPTFDGSEALFTKDDAPPNLNRLSDGVSTIHIDTSDNEGIKLTAESNSKGILILTDSYYPGWKCYVNGLEKPIYRVNYFMRGIEIDPGKSIIKLRFEPEIFTTGEDISTLSIFMCLAGLAYLKRKFGRRI